MFKLFGAAARKHRRLGDCVWLSDTDCVAGVRARCDEARGKGEPVCVVAASEALASELANAGGVVAVAIHNGGSLTPEVIAAESRGTEKILVLVVGLMENPEYESELLAGCADLKCAVCVETHYSLPSLVAAGIVPPTMEAQLRKLGAGSGRAVADTKPSLLGGGIATGRMLSRAIASGRRKAAQRNT